MLLVDFKDIELDKKMGKNKFLPVSSDVEAQDIELSLMSEGRPAAAVAAMGHVTQSLPKATKTKPWVKKMFSALAFLGLLFGGTIGFSTIVIAEDQVGYYNSESGYMGPGTYLQFPWATEKMQIVKVRGKYLRLDNLAGVAGNHKFRIKKIYVHYTVTDVDKYIQTLKEVSPTYCRTEMRNAILVYLMPGDLITIDAEENTIAVDVSDAELEQRKANWKAPELKVKRGSLYKYAHLVGSASKGCLTDDFEA